MAKRAQTKKAAKTAGKKPAARRPAAKKAPAKSSDETRLALDRFLIGLWTDKDFLQFLSAGSPAARPLAALAKAQEFDRPRAAEALRQKLFGQGRPTELERFEALLRQGVDCVAGKMPVLAELQHDLLAHADVLPKEDPRVAAMRVLADYAAAWQVNVAVQAVGRLAEATVDRVANARRDALARLEKALAGFAHLAP